MKKKAVKTMKLLIVSWLSFKQQTKQSQGDGNISATKRKLPTH